ncbi:flagella cluster protein [Halostagnicola larsenii XH-48]|uniref:Flagella cluster protein n=1 Tax=Halostagnicola larsenii XH-48 TaxID=797299 RepID=W0JT64_9EURY|nr:flagella cluster protein [Halostagnicola larsenii]AHG00420.1 flagella cluster protein [Halostagnicola larsenii XH-48]
MTNGNPDNPKENADVPPVLPEEQQTPADAGGVLSPDDLDISESPYVAEISDGRYVVSPNKSPPNVAQQESLATQSQSGRPSRSRGGRNEPADRAGTGGQIQSPEAARSVLADELDRLESRYAIDLISQFDGNTIRHRTASDDVVGTFDNLVLWYAQSVSQNTPTTRAISLLLARSEFGAPLTETRLRNEIGKHGLTESNTIGDLLERLE